MLKRASSLWLFLSSLILVVMIFLPIATIQINGVEFPLLYTARAISYWDAGEFITTKKEPLYLLLTVNIALALTCFVNIFNYKKSLQKKIVIASIILISVFDSFCIFYTLKLPIETKLIQFEIAAYLPLIAVLFCILAITNNKNSLKENG
nr:DUF4293 family protein [Pedobacter sp. ASV2]